MYKLPLACNSAEIGTQIRATIRQVEEVETNENGVEWGKFLRVRIRINLTKPLAKGRRLKIQGFQCGSHSSMKEFPGFVFIAGLFCMAVWDAENKQALRGRGKRISTEPG